MEIFKNSSKLPRRIFGFILCSVLFYNIAFAQEPNFTVIVYPTTVLMGNQIKVEFVLENASGSNFQPPSFEGFQMLVGPNQSSSFSMINGAVTQSLSYTYYLEAIEVGNYYIEPASIENEGEVLSTLPIEVLVEANPDGIIQEPQRKEGFRSFDFFKMPELRGFPELPNTPKEKTKPKKNRKIYRI